MAGPSPKVFVREATGLVREMGVLDQFLMSFLIINVMGGFVFTAIAAPYFFPGADLPVVFLLGSIPALAMAYVYSRMSAGMSRSGGDYVWSSRIMGPLYASIQLIFILGVAITSIAISSWLGIALGIPQLIFSVGILTNSHSLLGFASSFAKPGLGYTTNAVVFVFLMLLGILSLRVYKWVQGVGMILYFIGTATFVVLLFTITPASFTSAFDGAMKMAGYSATYSSIVQSAASQGFSVTQFNWTNTALAAIPWGFFTFTNFNFGTYLAGETKSPKASFFWALIVSVILASLGLFVIGLLYYNDFGLSFVSALAYTNVVNPSALPAPPTGNFLVSLANPLAGIVVSLALIVISLIGSTADAIAMSRMLFAGSFDRLLPSKFASVNERFHTPHWAMVVVGIIAGAYLTIYWNAGWAATFLNTSILLPIGYLLPLLAIAVFPFRKKELFNRTVGAIGTKRASIAIAGFVGVISFGFYAFSETFPIISSVYLGSNLLLAYSVVVIMILVGAAIYGAAKVRMQNAGIDLKRIYEEIPPE